MTEIVVTEKPKKPKPKPKVSAEERARLRKNVKGQTREAIIGGIRKDWKLSLEDESPQDDVMAKAEQQPGRRGGPVYQLSVTDDTTAATPVTTDAPAVVAGGMEPFLQGLRDNGATEEQVERARTGTYEDKMKVSDEVWAANQPPPPEVVTTTTTEAAPAAEAAPPPATTSAFFRGVDQLRAGNPPAPGSPEAIAIDKAVKTTYAGNLDAFFKAMDLLPSVDPAPVTTAPPTTTTDPPATTTDPAPTTPPTTATPAITTPPTTTTPGPPPISPLRKTIRAKAEEVITGLGIEDRAREEEARLELIRESAQRGREQLGRIFAIDPGGLVSGGAQRKFELFEADVSRQRVAAQIGLTTERFSRALANLEALTGAEVALGELGIKERGLTETERATREEERFRREEAIGRVQAASGIYTPTLAEREVIVAETAQTEEERAALVRETLTGRGLTLSENELAQRIIEFIDTHNLDEERFQEAIRQAKEGIRIEDEQLAAQVEQFRTELIGDLTESVTLESMGVPVEQYFDPDGTLTDTVGLQRAMEGVKADFQTKYGRELTDEEAQRLINRESILVQTEAVGARAAEQVEAGRAALAREGIDVSEVAVGVSRAETDRLRAEEEGRAARVREAEALAELTGVIAGTEEVTLESMGVSVEDYTNPDGTIRALGTDGLLFNEVQTASFAEKFRGKYGRDLTAEEVTSLSRGESITVTFEDVVAPGTRAAAQAEITRAAMAREKIEADRVLIEAGRLEEVERATLVSEAEASAILTGVLVTEDITLESMGVAIEDFMRPDGSGALDEDKLYMSREIERVQGDFLAKYGRDLTTEEVDSLIRGEAIRVEQVTQQSKEFRASLEQRADEFQLEYDRLLDEFTGYWTDDEGVQQVGLSRAQFLETKRQFDRGMDPENGEFIRRFNKELEQAKHEFTANNKLDALRQGVEAKIASTNQAIQRARETGTYIDPETGDTEDTLISRQFYLDRQRAISAETGQWSPTLTLKDDFGIDPTEFMDYAYVEEAISLESQGFPVDKYRDEDGRLRLIDTTQSEEMLQFSADFLAKYGRSLTQEDINILVRDEGEIKTGVMAPIGDLIIVDQDGYNEARDTISSNFSALFDRVPSINELNRLLEGNPVSVVRESMVGRRMDLEEGRNEFDEILQEAESKGFWIDEGGYRVNTLSKNIANDARDAETARVNLGLAEIAERLRQFDLTKTQRDEEFLTTSELDQDQFDEAKSQYTRSIDARAAEFASNLGLEKDIFLQSVREFRAGTLGLVEGARDVTSQSLGIDIDRLTNLRSLEAAGQLGDISLTSFLSDSTIRNYVKADGSIDSLGILFNELEGVQEDFIARYGISLTTEEVESLAKGRTITAPGTEELPELEARILDDIRAALPGATEEQLQQVSTGGTVNVDTMVSLEGRRISEAVRQFDQELLLRRAEDRTRILDITTNEALDRIKYGLEDDRLKQSKELFGKEMDQRISEWADTHGLNATQAADIKADMEGRLKLSQDQLEQEFVEFAARNQLDLAELTGQTAIGGIITAEELGIPTGIPMLADGKTMDLDTFVERVGLLQEAFELATGQELSPEDAEAMMGGEGIEVEGLPTLAAKSLAATITSQQMRLATDISKIAREYDLNVSAFEQSIVESNRAFNEASKQAAIDNGLDANRFAQAITAWEAQDVNSKAALRMNLSQITGLTTGEGEITPEELGITQEGLYKPVFEQITLEDLGLHELAETRGGGGLKLFADARESLDPPGVTKDGRKRKFDWNYFAQAEDDPHPGVWDAAMRIVQDAAFDKYGISISQEQAQELTGDTEGKRSVNWRDLEEAGTTATRVSHGLQTAEFNNLTNRSIEGPPIPGREGERNEEVFAEKIRQYQEAFFLATGQELSFKRAEESLAPDRGEIPADTWIENQFQLADMVQDGVLKYDMGRDVIEDLDGNVLGTWKDFASQWRADKDFKIPYPFGAKPGERGWVTVPSIGIGVTELPTMAAKQIAATFGLQLDQFNTAKSQFDANFDAQLSSVARNFKMDEEQHNAAISVARARAGHMQTFMHDIIGQFDPTGKWQTDELTAITNLLNGGSMGWASPERGGSAWQAIASIAGAIAPVALALMED